jgi:hypothetical protein
VCACWDAGAQWQWGDRAVLGLAAVGCRPALHRTQHTAHTVHCTAHNTRLGTGCRLKLRTWMRWFRLSATYTLSPTSPHRPIGELNSCSPTYAGRAARDWVTGGQLAV